MTVSEYPEFNFNDDALRRQIEQISKALDASIGAQLEPLREQAQAAMSDALVPALREFATRADLILKEAASPALLDATRRFSEIITESYGPSIEAVAKSLNTFAGLSSFRAPREVLESIARAADVDIRVPEELFDALVEDLDEAAEEDDSVAQLRTVPFAQLSADQRDAVGRFILRWSGNFMFDLGIGNHVFGDMFVGEVLQWAAVLAVVQVILYMVVLKPNDPS